jgi:hypothetical protein
VSYKYSLAAQTRQAVFAVYRDALGRWAHGDLINAGEIHGQVDGILDDAFVAALTDRVVADDVCGARDATTAVFAIPPRAVELAVVDSLRQMGCKLRQDGGVTYLITEIFDEGTGDLLHRLRVLDLERFSQTLALNW